MKLRAFILYAGLTMHVCYLSAQSTPIGSGWANNSVNAAIFRKNAVVTFNNTQYASYYDSTGHVVLAKRTTGSNRWEVKQTPFTGNINDAHCSISIMVDGDGYLHMSWDHHDNQLHYCRSIAPEALQLEDEVMIGRDEDRVSYPEFLRMPCGDLIFMYRNGASGNGNLVINKFSLSEKKWTRMQDTLIDGEGQRNAYWQSCTDDNGTIHLSWVWRETWDVATNHDLCYARSADGGVSWQRSDGKPYALPITSSTAEYVCMIPQNSDLINQTSMCADKDGRPYIASYWRDYGDLVPQYHLVYLNPQKSGWITKRISDRKTPFTLSGGGTKKIPVSRPQVLVKERNDSVTVYLIYRDIERGNKASVNISMDSDFSMWRVYDLSGESLGSWEPAYDTELWRNSSVLNIFEQKVGQGDEENLEIINSQPVFILEMPSTQIPQDTLIIK